MDSGLDVEMPKSPGAAERRAALLDRVERVTETPMLVLAMVFLVVLVLPEMTQLPPEVHDTLDATGWFIWAAFTLELSIKTYLAPQRVRYLMQHWPDVLTVALPFLRPLRLLRVAITLARVATHARRVLRNRTLSLAGVTCLIALSAGSTLVFIAERGAGGPISSFADALWWATTTITTVGYGDVYPTTAAGRGIAVFLMLTGISLFGLLTARVAAFFVEEAPPASAPELAEILARLRLLETRLEELRAERTADDESRTEVP